MDNKAKVDKEHHIKLTNFCASKDIINRMKRQPTQWRKYLQIISITLILAKDLNRHAPKMIHKWLVSI